MNVEPPPEPEPDPALAVDPLDEHLSAALDGHDAPGHVDLDTAPARQRRAALETARDLLATPPPPLDDLARRRILQHATAAAPVADRRESPWLTRASVAAAAIVVVALAAVAFKTLDHRSGSSSKASSAPSEAAAPDAAGVPTGPLVFAEVSDPAVLKREVQAALRPGAAPESSPHVSPDTTAATPFGSPTTTAGGVAPSPSQCVSSVRAPAGVAPELLATATFHGQPALVVIGRDRTQTLVFVVSSTDCRLLSSQFLRR